MKVISSIALLFIVCTHTKAQITINGNDLPQVNAIYLRDNATNTGIIDLNQTGANMVWDYSTLSSSSTDTIIYGTVASTNFAYQLYFNNPFSPEYDSDLAIPGADFPSVPLSPITITDVINYFKIANDGYYQTGFGATISGIPASIKYTPRDKILPLPCTFGLNETNPFEWIFQVPGVGVYGQNKNRTVEVDGWGTLLLPGNQTINALRVKSTVTGTDTIYVDQFSFGISIPSSQVDYKWYAQGEGEPVLAVTTSQMGGNTQITGATYKHIEANAIEESNEALVAQIFPNPASDYLTIQLKESSHERIKIEILDITGKICFQQWYTKGVSHKINIPTTHLSDGFYTIRLFQHGAMQNASLLIKK